MRSDVPSTLPFNFHVSVVGLGFPSATFVKLEHQSKGMKEPLLEWFQLWNSSKIASLTLTNWDNAKGLGWFTSTSSTQTSLPFFLLRKKMLMKKFGWRHSHLVSSYQTNSMNWLVKMKKCTSSAHTLWNVNTGYHLTTSTSLKNTMSWLRIQTSARQKLRHVIWKLKFLNCNKNLAIHM